MIRYLNYINEKSFIIEEGFKNSRRIRIHGHCTMAGSVRMGPLNLTARLLYNFLKNGNHVKLKHAINEYKYILLASCSSAGDRQDQAGSSLACKLSQMMPGVTVKGFVGYVTTVGGIVDSTRPPGVPVTSLHDYFDPYHYEFFTKYRQANLPCEIEQEYLIKPYILHKGTADMPDESFVDYPHYQNHPGTLTDMLKVKKESEYMPVNFLNGMII
jgi:hypothetical protein